MNIIIKVNNLDIHQDEITPLLQVVLIHGAKKLQF